MFSSVRTWSCVGLALCFAFLPAARSHAEELQLASYSEEAVLFGEIPSVTGASKYEQKVTEAPSSVSIITRDEIKKYGYRTLADVLKSVRGFSVTYDRNYSYVGVRGFGRPADYNTRILVLIDGHRTNDNVFNQAMVGTEGILDIDLVERIEVIRGPGSSLYGSNAFFGVINVITRRGRDLKGAEVAASAGSARTYAGRVSYGNRYSAGPEVIASASAADSRGDRLYFPEFDNTLPTANARAVNNGTTRNSDYDRLQNAFTTVAYGDFTVQGAYSSRTKGIPTGAFGTDFNSSQNRTVDTRSYVDVKYEHGLGARTDLTARFYYDYYEYQGDYAYFTTGGTLNKDVTYGSWAGTELKIASRITDAQHLITGIEYQGSLREDQENYDLNVYPRYLDDVRRSRILAAYLQDEIAFSRSLILNAGVRYDHYSTFGGTTNPRLALLLTPSEKSTVKLIYGGAFRAPNAYELYYRSPGLSESNPDLKPEKIKTYELVFERYLGEHLSLSAGAFYYRITDLINYTTDAATGLAHYQNIEAVAARGGEVELEGKWRSGVEGRASYTIQRAVNTATNAPLTNSPAHQVKLNVSAPLFSNTVFVGAEEQYLSRRRTEAGSYTGGFCVTNLTLSARNVLDRFELSASVYNLFDKEYGDPVSLDFVQNTILQDGRSYRFQIVYAF